jgi:hypothetical protein
MKNLILSGLLLAFFFNASAQKGVKYDASVQPKQNLQYFRPKGNNLFVGDCIPFYHKGTYYSYWLLDSANHKSLNGLGGHQWVLSTSKDLKTWEQFPIVLGIDEDWEKSICTGSIVYHKNKFYAFYATRLVEDGKINEQLSYAISNDGIHFKKQKPNPFYTSAPGYSKRDFRDPKVFVDAAGEFHLFVSSSEENPKLKQAAGCLVHLSSRDLKTWTVHPPILTGQATVPECPDYFLWKGWYYLVYSDGSNTFYVKSKKPYGPWEEPASQALNEEFSNVVKTAEFNGDRRIAAAWIPTRSENKDNGYELFGGNQVFRELTQQTDGTLSTKFPSEMIPATEAPLKLVLNSDSPGQNAKNSSDFTITSYNGVGSAHYQNIPNDCRISVEIDPQGLNEDLGLYLRSAENAASGYKLSFSAVNQTVTLGNTRISGVSGMNKPFKVDIIMKESMIDVSVDGKRCIVNRTPEQKGSFLWFYAKHGKVNFKSVKVSPLINN